MKKWLLSLCLVGISISCRERGEEGSLPKEDGMVQVPGGDFEMGSSGVFDTPFGRKEFPEEAPVRAVSVKGFWIDETEVTNDQFARFVKETGYVTFAERPADRESFPEEVRANLPEGEFHQGSVVFAKPEAFQGNTGDPDAYLSWWRWDPDANWRHPEGKGSSIEGLGNHPVVCVSHEDASAYAKWVGKRLPTEAEWEYAARGGLKGALYVWGDETRPGGKWMANTFQGEFPALNTAEDGFAGTAPVKSYPANGFGLYDMAGNAWEICADFYDAEYPAYCSSENPQGPETWFDPASGGKGEGLARHVTKGGSFLCHVSYCMRYRPAARHSLEEGSPANHTGFRCVKD